MHWETKSIVWFTLLQWLLYCGGLEQNSKYLWDKPIDSLLLLHAHIHTNIHTYTYKHIYKTFIPIMHLKQVFKNNLAIYFLILFIYFGLCWVFISKCLLSPCLFNLYSEHIMWNAKLDTLQAGIKSAWRNINNFRYVEDTTLMTETKKKSKSLLMRMKKESEKAG